ncbi:guided entry of tail-anchored proteins factor 1-like [Macrosteles quadrilineatus]|uniref:guided entry of tail-anchored proteins factor 1-like n=1 Tax=Macrosteles quadrilineatus TaxID=74068 RepID=UPI0023E195CD|nr:guided entry of tail-anchored proteins factor 1-like [Macrosteles quadrilineatus]
MIKNKFCQTSRFQELRQSLSELQKESTSIDMTNEFAKYARLQRKIIKVQEELKKEVSVHKEEEMKNKLILRIVVGLVCIVMVYTYNSQPVVQLDPDWVYPVGSVLCWPGGQLGSISFMVWCAISNSVIRTFS